MNNSTKIRLHLSKNLFESIAKEVLTEAKKANDGYTVAVKQPKAPKQSKSQAASPEVQKTDAEATMGEATPAKETPGTSTSTLAKDLRQKAQDVTKTSGISSKEIQGLQKLLNTILAKALGGELAVAIDKAQKVLDTATQDVKSKVPTSTSTTSVQDMNMGPSGKPAMPGLREMETNVAEEDTMEEGVDYAGLATMLGTLLGVGGTVATAIIKDLKNAKTPEEKKQILQSLNSQMDKSKGFNNEAKKDKEDKDTLKEYEHHYEMVNGQCRRYNDEGDYTVVSSHYCR